MLPIDGLDHPYSIKTRPPCDSDNLSPHHGIENETEWFDPKAFYNQKQSTKQTTSYLSPLNFKSKTSIIGLPRLPTHSLRSNSVSVSRRQPTAHLFPKWASRSVAEPGSPEVSCIGKVSPRLRLLPGEPRSPRFWSRVLTALGSRRKQAEADDPPTPASAGRREGLRIRRKQDETDDPPTPASAGRREGLRFRRNQTEADDPPTPASARLRDFLESCRKQAEADDPPTPGSAQLREALRSRRKQAEADDLPTPVSARRVREALSTRRKQAEADDPPTPGSARLGGALRSRRKHAEADDPPTPGSAGRREALDGEKDASEIATPPSLGWIKKLTSGRRSEMGVQVTGPDTKNENSGRSPRFWARQMASIGGPDRDGGARCMMMPMHHTTLVGSIR
ncbi:hypothetical protein MRB53_018230 [Persea americana]|uniref:Uncharacterized protein n=1 Tax=Persea americana TaxID=3435 RepID=A0ACC2M7D2_PERAE|nr:hypothetical protein MRB53_018230 [Persea americana]